MAAISRRDHIGAAASAGIVIAAAALLHAIHPAAFWRDDFQLQYLPASREVVRAWSEGSFPLLSRFSWFGGALAGEFQHGVFSIFLTVCDFVVWSIPMPLATRAAALSTIQLAVAAAGAFQLSRSYEIRPLLAIGAAVVTAMNGWNVAWGSATWYPEIAAFAWLPWYWFAIRHPNRRVAVLGGGAALYLLITAGWPYAVVMAGAVTLLELHSLSRTVAACLLGFMLSAPATLMLGEYFQSSFRLTYSSIIDRRWVVPFSSLIGFVLPTTREPWLLWTSQLPHSAIELAGAVVPIGGIFAAAITQRKQLFRKLRPEWILLVVILALILLPSVGIFRWPFRWLPLVHLLLAIVGFSAIQQTGDRAAAICCCAIVIGALAIDAFIDLQLAMTFHYAIVLLAAAALWSIIPRDAAASTVAIASIVILFLFFPQPPEVARWNFDDRILETAPLDPSTRYLELARWWDDVTIPNAAEPARAVGGAGESLRPGNTPMYAGVEFINGYSPVGPAGLRSLLGFDIHGPLRGEYLDSVAARETAPGALLDHMSVGGLVVAKQWVARATPLLAERGWSIHGRLPDGAVFTRTLRHDVVWSAIRALAFADEQQATQWIRVRSHAVMPVVLRGSHNEVRQFAPRALSDIHNDRLSASVNVGPSNQASLIVFSRPWFPGYVASIGGHDVPVVRADLLMPAVELRPNEQGLLVLRYRPRSLVIGVIVALAGVVAAVVFFWVTDSTMYSGRRFTSM